MCPAETESETDCGRCSRVTECWQELAVLAETTPRKPGPTTAADQSERSSDAQHNSGVRSGRIVSIEGQEDGGHSECATQTYGSE